MATVTKSRIGTLRAYSNIDLSNLSIIDMVSGSFSKAVRSIWRNHIVSYLTASDFRRHVWHAWLSENPDPEPDHEILDFLLYSRSKDIIAAAYRTCPRGYLSALKRLDAKAREPRTYQSLFSVLSAGGRRAKLVHHAREIDDDMICNLAAVPHDDFSSVIVSRLLDRKVDPEKFYGAIWVASRISLVLGPDQVVDAVSKASSSMKALRELVLRLPFPPSPLEFRSPLIPVKSVEEVRALSGKFRNCLSDMDTLSEVVFAIQSGQQHLYHWDDGENSAVILIQRFASLGWVIAEAYGIGNRRLSEDTMRQIEQRLGGITSLCLAWPLQMTIPTRGWFFE